MPLLHIAANYAINLIETVEIKMKKFQIKLSNNELLMVLYALDKESEHRLNKSEQQSDEAQKKLYLDLSKDFANVSRTINQQWI